MTQNYLVDRTLNEKTQHDFIETKEIDALEHSMCQERKKEDA